MIYNNNYYDPNLVYYNNDENLTKIITENYHILKPSMKEIFGLKFYERSEIKDALAYLRLINQSNDDLSFERIINTPKRAIGDSSVKKNLWIC